MRGKKVGILLLAGVILFGAGCGLTDDPDPPKPLVIDRTLIVENGAAPVWVGADEEAFLFVYQDTQDQEGIFLSDMEGTVSTLYEGSHNHDYTPSADGVHVAFSTPTVDGGVMVSDLGGNGTLLLPGGRDPAWMNNSTLVATDATGRLVQFAINNPEPEPLINQGSHAAVSADGSKLAYLVNSSSAGLALRYVDFEELLVTEIATLIGTDIIWDPVRPYIYGSRFFPSANTSDVVRVALSTGSNNTSVEIAGATHPSVSRDGSTLFANRLTDGSAFELIYKNLATREQINIPYSTNASAGNGRHAIVEQVDGVYFISF